MNSKCPEPVDGIDSEQDGEQLTPVGFVKFTIEIGSGGGEKDPAVDLNAIAAITAPGPCNDVTVGAAPLVAAKFIPLPS
jgi:hypothetical protein